MMKRNMALIMALVMTAMSLAGCGQKGNVAGTNLADIDVDKYITELGAYQNIEVEEPVIPEITDATIDDYINYMLSQCGITDYVKTDKTVVENGDVANIDYCGSIDGVEFEGGKAEGYDLVIGSGTFIPGFEDALIGKEVGFEGPIDVTFPEEYGAENLAGKAAVFDIKINYISEQKEAELTDENAATLALMMGSMDIASADALREYVKTNLTNYTKQLYDENIAINAVTCVLDNTKFSDEPLPADILENVKNELTESDQKSADYYGVELKEYVETTYSESYDAYIVERDETAARMVQILLVAEKIARLEKIEVTDEEIQEGINNEAANNQNANTADATADTLQSDKGMVRNYLIQNKVAKKILETATIVAPTKADTASQEATTETSTEE